MATLEQIQEKPTNSPVIKDRLARLKTDYESNLRAQHPDAESFLEKAKLALNSGTKEAVDAAEKALADLNIKLPLDQRTVVGATGKNAEKLTKPLATEVKSIAQDAEKALKQGDTQKWAAVAEDLAKKAAAAVGWSALLVAAKEFGSTIRDGIEGVKSIFAAIGEMIMKFLGPILEPFKALFSAITGKTEDKKDGKKEEKIAEKESERKQAQLTLEQQKEARENMAKSTEEYISKKFLYGENLSTGKREELKKIIGDHEFPTEAFQAFLKKTDDRVTLSDGMDLVEKVMFNHAGLVLKLALAGCIPMKRVILALGSGEIQGAKTHFALTLDGIGIPPSSIGMDEMQKIADQYKDNPKMRANYLYLMYKPASILSAIAGAVIGWTASLAIGLTTDTTVDSIKMAKDVWKGHNAAQYEELIKNFSLLESKLGIEAGKGTQFSEGLRNLQNLTGYVRNNYILLEYLEKYKNDVAGFTKDPQVKMLLSSNMDGLNQVKSEKELREFVRKAMMKWEGTLGLAENMKRWASELGGSWNARMFEQAEKLNGILDLQSRLAIREPAVLKWYQSLQEVKKIATISRVQDTTMLMVKDEQSLRELAPTLAKLGAEGVKHLFNGLPMIGLYVGARDLLHNEKERTSTGEWLKTIIAAMSMPIGGFVLMNEAAVVKGEDGKYGVENLQQGLIGASLFAGGMWYTVRGGSAYEAMMRFTGMRTITQAGETLTAGVRGARTMWRVAGKVKPELGQSVARAMSAVEKTPGSGRVKLTIAWGAALAVALTIAIKNSKDPYADAVKEGFVDLQTGTLTKKFDQEFEKQDLAKKKEMLDAVAYAWYRSEGIENPETGYENGAYEVYAHNIAEAKKLQRAVNNFSDDFGGHGVTIVEASIENKKT